MNVLVYPSTHTHAASIHRSLSSILVPHYLPQIISPDVLAAPENPWQSSCALLVLLAAPDHHPGVQLYAESGGRILALGVNATRSQGLEDHAVLRLVDGRGTLHLSFPSAVDLPGSIDLGDGARSLSDDHTITGALHESGTIALWSCSPPLREEWLVQTLSALGLRCDQREQPEPSLLPQLLLAHPDKWNLTRDCILHALFPNRDLEAAFSTLAVKDDVTASESALFPDEHDTFRFHIVRKMPVISSECPILGLLPGGAEEGVKDVVLTPRPLTAEQERHYTPFFSPTAYFTALDKLRPASKTDSPRMGDILFYGQVVTSTQTMLDKNPKLLSSLPSPLLSLATVQMAGRGRGRNTWLSPAGSMLMSLKLNVPLRNARSLQSSTPSIRPTNLVFIQYLFALAVVEACQALDPAKEWATKVRLKWPNDIYGEFPTEEGRRKSELKKLGGVLVNTNFRGSTADVVIGCGLNVLNEPPIGSLAQLEARSREQATHSCLTVERVTATVVATFERLWNSFLAEESEGFRPFMDRYTSLWLHSDQTVTLTTTTPPSTVRIVGITPDYGLLRTLPLGGGQYIDLQPDGNSFDMLKGLIKTKTN